MCVSTTHFSCCDVDLVLLQLLCECRGTVCKVDYRVMCLSCVVADNKVRGGWVSSSGGRTQANRDTSQPLAGNCDAAEN